MNTIIEEKIVNNELTTTFENEFSREVWEDTYKNGDADINANHNRVAHALSRCESADVQESVYNDFRKILANFRFCPGGRILANAGTDYEGTTFNNCFVGGKPQIDQDSIEGILETLRIQALTLKSEGGWGMNFSFIRPRGSYINGVGISTPGSVAFMELFDKSSDIITRGSGDEKLNRKKSGKKKIRKGAQMAILCDWHPDIFEFITSKQSSDRLTKFNISVGISDVFMDKLIKVHSLIERGASAEEINRANTWLLEFPDTSFPEYKKQWNGDLQDWKQRGYPVEIYRETTVTELWDCITKATYNRNEPGVIFLDRANATHCVNYHPRAKIHATNPCGEQCLPFFQVCNLGSINLTQFVDTNTGTFDKESLQSTVKIAVRFMDNVIDTTGNPSPEYTQMSKDFRRIGLGVMGWGSSLAMLKVRYGSDRAEEIKEELMRAFTHAAVEASIDLAEEKGMFPQCDPLKHAQAHFWDLIELPDHLRERIARVGIRNSALFSCQPTGNTGVLCNNVSGGIEPLFLHKYTRTAILSKIPESISEQTPRWYMGEFHETELFKWVEEGDEKILKGKGSDGVVYKIDKNRGLTREVQCLDYGYKRVKDEWDDQLDWCSTALSGLTVRDHIRDMKGWSRWIDSAISKTLNIPNDYSFEDFQDIYLEAYKTGTVKGFTTYREGTMTAVLSKNDDTGSEKTDKTGSIIKTEAPKRSKELPCDVYHPTYKGNQFYCIVGMLGEDPYEIFVGEDPEFRIPRNLKSAKIRKVSRGVYELVDGEKTYSLTSHSDEGAQVLARMISTSLRHGSDIKYVCEQLNKPSGDFQSFAKVLSRTLKRYIKDGDKVSGDTCPNCGSHNLVYREGCVTCLDCGCSKCG